MSATHPASLPKNFDGTLGATFLGLLVSTALYGVTCLQVFMYYQRFPDDKLHLKITIGVLMFIDSLHTALATHGIYFYVVTNYANPKVLVGPPWSTLAQVFVSCTSNWIVRGFFARRIYKLCGEQRRTLGVILAVSIVAVSSWVLATGFGLAGRSFKLKTYVGMQQASWLLESSLVGAVVSDVIIAGAMCTLLLASRSGLKRTDSMISFIMAFTINTGLITSLASIATVLSYVLLPHLFVYIGIYFVIGKLYINSFLASLNARSELRSRPATYGDSLGRGVGTGSAPISFPMHSTQYESTQFESSGDIKSQHGYA